MVCAGLRSRHENEIVWLTSGRLWRWCTASGKLALADSATIGIEAATKCSVFPAIRCVMLRDRAPAMPKAAAASLPVNSDRWLINDRDTFRRGERLGDADNRARWGESIMGRSRQLSLQRHMMLHPPLMAALLVLFLAANVAGSISSQLWPVVVAAAAGVFCIIECRLAGLS